MRSDRRVDESRRQMELGLEDLPRARLDALERSRVRPELVMRSPRYARRRVRPIQSAMSATNPD